jgi:hypothetical protein
MAYYDDYKNSGSQNDPYAPRPLASQAAPGAGYRTAVPTAMPPPPAVTSTPSAYDPYEAFRTANQTGSADEILRKAYSTFTGRDADDEGLKSHMSNPYGLAHAVRTIFDSEEGQKYRTANPYNFQDPATRGPDPNAPPAAATSPGQPAAGAFDPTKVQAAVTQGLTPKYAMEGFDLSREQNTGKSAKDAFAFLSNNAPPPPINNKAQLGAWFNQYVAPGMNALGHRIISVDGDKFTFSNWQGTFTVDFGRGAGAEGGALAWQVDEGSAQMGNGAYNPAAPVNPAVGNNGQPVSSTMPVANPAMSSAITYRRPYEGYVPAEPVPQEQI